MRLKQPASVFVYFWLDGGVGGGGCGAVSVGGEGVIMMNETFSTVQRESDECHPIVPLWQSGRIAVSLPAQWQARLS